MPSDELPTGAGAQPAPAPRQPLGAVSPWQPATVERVTVETYRAKTYTLRLSDPAPFLAGQHYDVRLTAPDGYQAQRSYSIASSPAESSQGIDLTVELIPDGEVSPYFHEVVEPGDVLEVRGPIGGPFTWTTAMGGPLLLVAGGSGIVPLRSILAHRNDAAPAEAALLLYSARSERDVIYGNWLDELQDAPESTAVRYTFTRSHPTGWSGYARRVDSEMLAECVRYLAQLSGDDESAHAPLCYVCGPTGFVESVADALLTIGIPETTIRTERFGPTS